MTKTLATARRVRRKKHGDKLYAAEVNSLQDQILELKKAIRKIG